MRYSYTAKKWSNKKDTATELNAVLSAEYDTISEAAKAAKDRYNLTTEQFEDLAVGGKVVTKNNVEIQVELVQAPSSINVHSH